MRLQRESHGGQQRRHHPQPWPRAALRAGRPPAHRARPTTAIRCSRCPKSYPAPNRNRPGSTSRNARCTDPSAARSRTRSDSHQANRPSAITHSCSASGPSRPARSSSAAGIRFSTKISGGLTSIRSEYSRSPASQRSLKLQHRGDVVVERRGQHEGHEQQRRKQGRKHPQQPGQRQPQPRSPDAQPPKPPAEQAPPKRTPGGPRADLRGARRNVHAPRFLPAAGLRRKVVDCRARAW